MYDDDHGEGAWRWFYGGTPPADDLMAPGDPDQAITGRGRSPQSPVVSAPPGSRGPSELAPSPARVLRSAGRP